MFGMRTKQEPEPEIGIEKHKKNLVEFRKQVDGEPKTESLDDAIGAEFEAPRPLAKPAWVYTARLVTAVALLSGTLTYLGRGCIETSVNALQAAPKAVGFYLVGDEVVSEKKPAQPIGPQASAEYKEQTNGIEEKLPVLDPGQTQDYVAAFKTIPEDKQPQVARQIYDTLGNEERMSLIRHILKK